MRIVKVIVWFILAVLFTVSVIKNYSYSLFTVDVLIYWTFKLISFGAVGCIVLFFIKDVVLQKKPACKK